VHHASLESYDVIGMFLVGLLGSGHCLGMCGPVAIALAPASAAARAWQRIQRALMYNAGRVVTYTVVGGVAGGLGGGLTRLAPLMRVQVWVALASAILLAAFGLASVGWLRLPRSMHSVDATRLPGYARALRRVASSGGAGAMFGLGLMLGLLPCGFSMSAFSRALGAHGALHGAVLVLAFGLGTFPAMLAVGVIGDRLSARSRKIGQVVAGLILIAMAARQALMAVRGLV
jgi:sulfite exporter TauE/SafE